MPSPAHPAEGENTGGALGRRHINYLRGADPAPRFPPGPVEGFNSMARADFRSVATEKCGLFSLLRGDGQRGRIGSARRSVFNFGRRNEVPLGRNIGAPSPVLTGRGERLSWKSSILQRPSRHGKASHGAENSRCSLRWHNASTILEMQRFPPLPIPKFLKGAP